MRACLDLRLTLRIRRPFTRTCAALLLAAAVPAAWAQTTLVNVSYDVMRDFYTDLNSAFARAWRERAGSDVTIKMSHGGSKGQARALADGFDADVITLNEANDISSKIITRAKNRKSSSPGA